MIEFLQTAKQAMGLIVGFIGLSAAIGSAYVSRYKIKTILDKNKEYDKKEQEVDDTISEIKLSLDHVKSKVETIQSDLNKKVSNSELRLIDQKVMNATKTIETVSQDFSKQKELFTEIRIEMGSMHTELKNINQLLSELKSCAVISPKTEPS